MVAETGARATRLPIARVEWTSDEKPPWSGLKFTLPVGSDELSDTLRSRYCDGGNLRERKHMAAIEFLTAELQLMQSTRVSRNAFDVEDLTTSEAPSPRSDTVGSRSQQHGGSLISNISGSDRTSSPHAHAIQPEEASTVAPVLTPSARSGQQIVFSITDGLPQQLRTKRPMTKKEKAAYKMTRERGACTSCRRQKAKCTHVGGVYTESVGTEQGAKSKSSKRKLSCDASIDQAQTRKTCKPSSPEPGPQQDDSLSPSSEAVRPETHYPTPGFTEQCDPNVRLDSTGRWMPMARQGSQAETFRYVPPTFDPYGVPVPQQAVSPWPSLISVPGMDPCSPDFGPFHLPNIPDNPHQMGPMESSSVLGSQYPPSFPLFTQEVWNDQEYRRASPEPG